MGIVSESDSTGPYSVEVRSTNLRTGSTFTKTGVVPPDQDKSQTGYRSGPLSKQERQELELLSKTGTWGKQAEMLDALDRIQRATGPSPLTRDGGSGVNDRNYFVEDRMTSVVPASWRRVSTLDPYSGTNCVYVDDNVMSGPPSLESLEAEAGAVMRSYVPTAPAMDLTRSLGELKDTPRLLDVLRSLNPRSAATYGSAYLTEEFGVAPTVSDVQTLADTIEKSDVILRQFVRDSARIVHRRATRQLDQSTVWADPISWPGGSDTRLDAGVRVGLLHTGWGSLDPRPTSQVYVDDRSELRVFSAFEYFVGDPYGATSRLDSYAAKARKLLGGGLTLSVGYELTPFSWMFDWFLDVGGLLQYQQTVADNGVFQRAGGWVYERTRTIEHRISSYTDRVSTGKYHYTEGAGSCKQRFQMRRSGSPYSMSPTWDLNGFQWGIAAALGAAKMPGIKF